jgi:hypothetical protein
MPWETFKLPNCHWKIIYMMVLLKSFSSFSWNFFFEFQLWKFGCGDLKKLDWMSNSWYPRYVRILLANLIRVGLSMKIWLWRFEETHLGKIHGILDLSSTCQNWKKKKNPPCIPESIFYK